MNESLLSPLAVEALRLLGASIKVQRLRRGWSMSELARRAGVSHPTIIKVERGDPTVAVGTMFESAILVGVPLFDPDPVVRGRQLDRVQTELSLLPRAGRMSSVEADDDF
jgi:transcriptional regulator with XRE-family HTH domain